MNDINTSSELIKDALSLCTSVMEMITAAQTDIQRKYRTAGNDWNDSKYKELGDIVNNCNSSLKKPLNELNRCFFTLSELERAIAEYDEVNIYSSAFTRSDVGSDSTTSSNVASVFTGILKGIEVDVPNVRVENITYTKRYKEEKDTLRNAFNRSERKAFLRKLGEMDDSLLMSAGLSSDDIIQIRAGYVPDGYQVHHKLPLDDGGDNSLDNFVLIRNDPFHKVITNYQNNRIRGMNYGDSRMIDWPIPNGEIYTGV